MSREVAGIDNQALRPRKVNIKPLGDNYTAVRHHSKLKMPIEFLWYIITEWLDLT